MVFLASEILFFGALFTAYSMYRAQAPHAFSEAVKENTFWWGSGNTVVLLTSSLLVALAVHHLRHARAYLAASLVLATAVLGLAFLGIKGYEYYDHFKHGIFPGGQGHWFAEKVRPPGMAAFWTLYFVMTGLHAIHVIIGVAVLSVMGWLILYEHVTSAAPHPLENGAMYWHLVDIIWLFLWPLFYLTKG